MIEQEQIASQEAARLLNQTGTYLLNRGRYAEAEPIVQRTLAMCELVLKGNDAIPTASAFFLATSLNNLATLYLESVPGKSHPDMIALLINYADLLRTMKRDEEAKELELRETEEERERVSRFKQLLWALKRGPF